jgi:O-antigen ligase
VLLWARSAVVVSILVFVPFLFEQFDAPKAAAVRVLGSGAMAAALAATVRPRRGEDRTSWHLLDVAVLVWLGAELIATVASQAPRLSVFGDIEQHEGLLTSVGLAGIYASARLGTRDARDARRTLSWVAAAATLASLHALAQVVGLDRQPWQRAASYAGGRFMRPFATLGHANLLGVITAAALASTMAMAVADRRRRAPWIAAAAVLGTTTAATLSRGAWLGAAVGGSLASSLAWRLARAPSSRGRRGLLMGIGAMILAAALFFSVPMLRARFLEFLTPTTGTARARLEIWRTALAMWRAHPSLGVGPDAFALLFQRHQTPIFWRIEWGTIHFHAHSIYLHVLATRGLLGAAAAVFGAAALAAAVRSAWRRGAEPRSALVPWLGVLAALATAGAFGALGTAGATLLAVMLGSVAALAASRVSANHTAAAARAERTPFESAHVAADASKLGRRLRQTGGPRARRRGPRPGRLGWSAAWSWPGLLAAVLIGVPQARELRGLAAAHEARVNMPSAPADLARARCAQAADRAVSLLPDNDPIARLRASVYLTYATIAQGTPGVALPAGAVEGWLAEAERSARRATALAPQRAGNHQTLGNVLLAKARWGDREALPQALQAYRRCWEWAPFSAFALDQFAYQALDLGRPDLALAPARRAASLYPNEALTQGIFGEVERALGDTTAALLAYRHALAGNWRDVVTSREAIERSLAELQSSNGAGRAAH